MNVTGSVILGLVYLVPGVFFVAGLTRLYTTRSPSLFDGQISLGIVVAVVAAIAMHLIAITVCNAVSSVFGQPAPDANLAISLLLSDPRAEATSKSIARAGQHWKLVSGYFLSTSILSFALGRAANRLIKVNRKADWYDLLRPEHADFIWLTTDIEVGEIAYLYAGMVKDFRVSGDGDLERVVLLGCVRRPLKRPSPFEIESSHELCNERGWVSIPGEYVVLNMSSARTINVDYWYVESENEPETAPAGARRKPNADNDGVSRDID